jgi:hypothetical protein
MTTASFADANFRHARLGDRRRTRRLVDLVDQIRHRRPKRRKGESKEESRRHKDRESRLWVDAVRAIGPAPAGSFCIDVCDRGSDTLEFLTPQYVEVLRYCREKRTDLDWSLHDFFFAMARLGGHQNRQHDHPPGWLILWRGWTALQHMTRGANTYRKNQRCA